MALFLTMLPFYLLGNIHCMGMCGPLAMTLGNHSYRHYYLWGRLCSFALAGMSAAAAGQVLNVALQRYHMAAWATLFAAVVCCLWGLAKMADRPIKLALPPRMGKWLRYANGKMATLMLQDRAWPTFLFGFLTVALPCGQTLFVFSACALSSDVIVGLGNGFAFAVLTSPSLYLAMSAHRLLASWRQHYERLWGACICLVGILMGCRACADLEWIEHRTFQIGSDATYHLVFW
jgi:sulfite exporter TauE/SafE